MSGHSVKWIPLGGMELSAANLAPAEKLRKFGFSLVCCEFGAEKLTKAAGVPNSAWVGESTVNTGGRSYTVSANVACYNASTKTWITLQQAHAFAARCDLFVDDSGIVRAAEVKQ